MSSEDIESIEDEIVELKHCMDIALTKGNHREYVRFAGRVTDLEMVVAALKDLDNRIN